MLPTEFEGVIGNISYKTTMQYDFITDKMKKIKVDEYCKLAKYHNDLHKDLDICSLPTDSRDVFLYCTLLHCLVCCICTKLVIPVLGKDIWCKICGRGMHRLCRFKSIKFNVTDLYAPCKTCNPLKPTPSTPIKHPKSKIPLILSSFPSIIPPIPKLPFFIPQQPQQSQQPQEPQKPQKPQSLLSSSDNADESRSDK